MSDTNRVSATVKAASHTQKSQLSLDNWLAKRALISPNQLGLIHEGHSWTFAELYHLSIRCAYALRDSVTGTGIHSAGQATFNTENSRAGTLHMPHPTSAYVQQNLPERIGLMCANSAAAYVSIMAMMNLGVQIVMLNTRLSPDELDYQIRDCGITSLLCSSEYADKARDTVAAGAWQRTFSIQIIDLDELWKRVTSVTASTESFPDLLSPAELASASRSEFEMNEVMSILYTSGTTGEPKGVMQTYGNHYWSATASMLNTGLEPGDTWGAFTPLYHISGLSILLRSFIYGIPVCLYRKFDPALINADILSGQVTIVSVVAYALQKLLTNLGSQTYPASFRYMLLGGGFFSDSLLEECEYRGIPVIRSFGMSETCSQIIATPLRADYAKPGSSGIALFPNRVRIASAAAVADTSMTDSPAALAEISKAEEIGEIQIQSPSLCCGYLNKEEKYRASFTPDGWYKTGDIGYLDGDGYLYVKSRLAEMIISGGENIFPSEIEHCLAQHPAVGEAAVVGKPDSTWGYVPWAYVTPSAQYYAQPYDARCQNSDTIHTNARRDAVSQLPSNEELFAFLRQHLAGYKIPKQIVWLDSLPKTSIGKIQKFKLMEPDTAPNQLQKPGHPKEP